ncbi:hypothetical protein E4U59_000218, partial [Claviceps monticola]
QVIPRKQPVTQSRAQRGRTRVLTRISETERGGRVLWVRGEGPYRSVLSEEAGWGERRKADQRHQGSGGASGLRLGKRGGL